MSFGTKAFGSSAKENKGCELINRIVPKEIIKIANEDERPDLSHFQFMSYNFETYPSRINKDIHYQLGEKRKDIEKNIKQELHDHLNHPSR